MADYGTAQMSVLPATMLATAYLAPIQGTDLGIAILSPVQPVNPSPPSSGQMWPRGDYKPT